MGGSRIETRYAYDTSGNVTTITQDPTGLNRITALTYDTNGNLLTSRDSFGNTVTRTYNANNQLLTETRYLVPDPDGAGAGQPSVPLTTRYAYDGENHLRFVISAQGRVTEHKYNAAGQRTATLKYTGALYASANFAESDLVTWSGGQLTKLERTNYTYDFRGNLATLSAYLSTDASGNGTGTPLLTQFVYDQRGQLLQAIEARGSATVPNPATPNLPYATTYIYDGLVGVFSATLCNWGTCMTTTLN
jgi:YD repeat-containing protein